MIPILYEGNETQFTTNGIGRLSDAISCIVTEKRNGAYELEMEYPVDGVHYEDIQMGRYIFAKPAKYSNKQAFEIYQIGKAINGICTICAYHISYRLSMIPVMPFSTNSITAALNGLKTNAAEQNPFNFSTTKTTVANYNQAEPRDARSCLGGVQGSILDVFGGGEYEFDMFDVKLWQNRGQNRGFEIRYGKNLIDLKQETNIENTITGIVPYYKNESATVTLPEKVIETESAANFPYPRSVPVDLSSEFQETVPTVAQLRAAGNAYIASHEIGVPKVSLTVSFVNLAEVKGYEDIAVLEDVRLCDTVRVVFEKLGVDALAKVISTEYDTLKEKFTKIELGSSSTTLANRIAAQEKATEEQTSALQEAIIRATNLITGVSGGYVVMHTGDDGKPYEILIMDNEDINQAVHVWRWNKNGWGYSSNGYNGTYHLAATIDGGIVADFITTGKLIGLEIDNGNGTFHVDSAGHMKASSGEFTGDVTGSTITGSTLETRNGIKITNNVIEFTEWINALRAVHTIEGTEYTATIIQCEEADLPEGILVKLLNGTIVMNTESDTLNFAPSQFAAFRCNVVMDHELFVNGNMTADANLTVNGNMTANSVYSEGEVQVNKNTSTGQYGKVVYDATNGGFNFQNESNAFVYLAASSFQQASSKYIKENVEDIEDVDKILKLRPVEFDYKFGGHSYGFIAEEVEEVLPNLVHTPQDYNEEKVVDGDFTNIKTLAYDEFIPYLVKMIQKQQEEINELKERGK